MPELTYETRQLREDERDWLTEVLLEPGTENSSSVAVESGSCLSLQALVTWDGEERVAVATYVVENGLAEFLTLDTLREGVRVGRRLIEAGAAHRYTRRRWPSLAAARRAMSIMALKWPPGTEFRWPPDRYPLTTPALANSR
jgi:hypothetical protein